jgi:hypothetical protein
MPDACPSVRLSASGPRNTGTTGLAAACRCVTYASNEPLRTMTRKESRPGAGHVVGCLRERQPGIDYTTLDRAGPRRWRCGSGKTWKPITRASIRCARRPTSPPGGRSASRPGPSARAAPTGHPLAETRWVRQTTSNPIHTGGTRASRHAVSRQENWAKPGCRWPKDWKSDGRAPGANWPRTGIFS